MIIESFSKNFNMIKRGEETSIKKTMVNESLLNEGVKDKIKSFIEKETKTNAKKLPNGEEIYHSLVNAFGESKTKKITITEQQRKVLVKAGLLKRNA